eukprot:CAMPEP_0177792754 /NCGR_PEP_ID=MMETSP0491_2-20121128/24696_1 /TAXON_ID=63592 /ORGANISM="Tetraselmis chuii, Strain PLY429" /LENGTH=549 /DNA_ID=CAMNT_0019315195 /DNA_START=258 /DNA_END=1907 /DNA_ORIENTATION=+
MGAKRLKVVLSVVSFFILGTPVWYYTTSVSRTDLPYDDMLNVSSQQPSLPTTVRVWLCTDKVTGAMESTRAGNPEGPQAALTWISSNGCESADPLKLLRGRRLKLPRASTTACPALFGWASNLPSNASGAAIEDGLTGLLRQQGLHAEPGFYDVFLVDSALALRSGKVLQGPPRAASSPTMAAAAAASASLFSHTATPAEFESALMRNGDSRLILSLCNADPSSGSCSWDGAKLARALQPTLDMLLPLGTIEVESQVLQYTSMKVKGEWSAKENAYLMGSDELPFFVDLEWNLEQDRMVLSGEAEGNQSHSLHENNVLHLVVFIPPIDQRPLLIKQLSTGAVLPFSAFTVKSWGGVILYSPEQGCCADDLDSADKVCGSGVPRVLSEEIGIQDVPSSPIPSALPVDVVHEDSNGIASWEVDMLLRSQLSRNVYAAASTLSSLAVTVQNLPNLDIPDEVSIHVEEALRGLRQARAASEEGQYYKAAGVARVAKASADAAFFHPSIMAERSYPAQHLVAMYMPYFLPVTVPLLAGLKLEVMRRYKNKNKAS